MNTQLEPANDPVQRLNKYVALALGVSRRKADELIADGRITVNDQRAQLGGRLSPGDTIRYDGHTITPQKHVYLALNKPLGYVCSRRRQGDTPTIYELLPAQYHQLKPVGRLDKDSSGLILLTNDGDFAYRMTHPSFKKQKRYLVTLNMPLQPLHRQMISDFGVELPDGRSQLLLERQHDKDDTRWVIHMSEGRNRQIRRTFASLGYTVTKLHRTHFGAHAIGQLTYGTWHEINPL